MQLLSFWDVLAIQPNFFDDIVLDARLDKDLVINRIMWYCGKSLPVETYPETFKYFSDGWFKKNEKAITRLYESELLEYNPIENYDRTETYTRTDVGDRTQKANTDNTTDMTGGYNGNNNTTNSGSDTDTITDSVSAFDATGYSPRSQTVEGHEKGTTQSDESSRCDHETTTGNVEHETGEASSNTQEFTSNIHGNIGVTTSQQMLQSERETVVFTTYDWIATQYRDEFFVGWCGRFSI